MSRSHSLNDSESLINWYMTYLRIQLIHLDSRFMPHSKSPERFCLGMMLSFCLEFRKAKGALSY